MTDDNLLEAWCGVVRLERVPRELQLAVLRRLIAKIDKADPRGQPKRKPGRPRNDDGAL